MTLLNPHTRQPIKKKNTQEDYMRQFSALNKQVKWLSQQNLQISLYVDWVVEKIQTIKDADGNQLVVLDLEEFPEFAEARFQEIQEQAAANQQAQMEETLKAVEAVAAEQVTAEDADEVLAELNLDES